jgi:M penetrans paralogue family 26
MDNQPQSIFQTASNAPKQDLPNATAVLVLGIISIVGCICYGVIGLICGVIALVLAKKDITAYNLDPTRYTESSYNNLKAGRVCGIIGLSLSALFLAIIIVEFIFLGSYIFSHPGWYYQH